MRVLIVLLLLLTSAFARELYPGQWADSDPQRQQWFQRQTVPKGQGRGNSCCSQADATSVEEDIKNGNYWVRFNLPNGILWADGDPMTPWLEVPQEAVIDTPARYGPVVWYYNIHYNTEHRVTKIEIRCYVPGAKT